SSGEITVFLTRKFYINIGFNLTLTDFSDRLLVDDENYPQVARSDFFDIRPYSTIISLPRIVKASGLGKSQSRDVQIPLLDAVVGNPPYIQQESISAELKEKYQIIAKPSNGKLSGRSDIHCYFWVHSLSFLKEDGYLCFLTSSQWLDAEYGFRLQDFILQNFDVIAVLESSDEPWFVGARVITTVTILRRQLDEQKRMENVVRFIQIRQPIAEILAHDGTTAGAIQAADRFRDELLSLDSKTRNSRYRARLVSQRDLWMEGVKLGKAMGKSGDDVQIEEDVSAQPGTYYGGKWGVYLRAPDLWFGLLDRLGQRMVLLGELAEVRRGITTGKDIFFYPKDVTDETLNVTDDREFYLRFQAQREEVVSGRVKIVKCGEGYEEMHPIESHFLQPVMHGPMEVSRFQVSQEDCGYKIIQIPSPRKLIAGTYALQYIEWGEANGFDQGPTCQSRITQEREWYDLTGRRQSPALWIKERQYRHLAPANPERLLANCRVYDIYPPSEFDDSDLWGGILNSTIVFLSCFQYGRPVGNEGLWGTMVVDTNIMRIPNPCLATERQRQKVARAFRNMIDRPIFGFLSERRLRRMQYVSKGKEAELNQLSDETELTQPDRRQLDDAVLEMMGIRSLAERTKILDELYSYLADFFEWTRQKEEKAIQNKNRSNRRRGVRPSDIAREIFVQIEQNNGALLRTYDDFLDHSQPFNTYEVPKDGKPKRLDSLFQQFAIEFVVKTQASIVVKTGSDARRELLLLVVQQGTGDFVRIPLDDDLCLQLHSQYSSFLKQRADSLRAMVEERTADPELQEKIYADLLKRIQITLE
ncbi:MAG: SAM-dependent methyltransferase, partial [Leptolyngbya sp.]